MTSKQLIKKIKGHVERNGLTSGCPIVKGAFGEVPCCPRGLVRHYAGEGNQYFNAPTTKAGREVTDALDAVAKRRKVRRREVFMAGDDKSGHYAEAYAAKLEERFDDNMRSPQAIKAAVGYIEAAEALL